jgi:hypothetical protein
MKLSRLLLAVGFTWLAAHAAEKTPEPVPAPATPPADFKSLDTDGDGRLSLDEFTAPAVVHRAAKQGQASAAGTPSGADPLPAAQDGILSATDSIEGRYSPEVFGNLDVDHDKFVSPEELEALLTSAHNIKQP